MDETGLCEEDGNLNVKVEEENRHFEDCLVPEKYVDIFLICCQMFFQQIHFIFFNRVWKETEGSPEEDGYQDSSPSFSCASPEPPLTPQQGFDTDGLTLPLDEPVDIASSSIIVVATGGVENEHSNNNIIPKPHVVTFSDTSASHYNNQSNGGVEVTKPFREKTLPAAGPAPYSLYVLLFN